MMPSNVSRDKTLSLMSLFVASHYIILLMSLGLLEYNFVWGNLEVNVIGKNLTVWRCLQWMK